MIELYGAEYLNRVPSIVELSHITDDYGVVGFPGCIGALDCMNLHWNNFPKQFKG